MAYGDMLSPLQQHGQILMADGFQPPPPLGYKAPPAQFCEVPRSPEELERRQEEIRQRQALEERKAEERRRQAEVALEAEAALTAERTEQEKMYYCILTAVRCRISPEDLAAAQAPGGDDECEAAIFGLRGRYFCPEEAECTDVESFWAAEKAEEERRAVLQAEQSRV